MTTNPELKRKLREVIEQIQTDRGDIVELQERVQTLQAEIQAKTNNLTMAIGARQVLASLFLPDGKTLSDAWAEDFDGLRTGAEPQQETDQ